MNDSPADGVLLTEAGMAVALTSRDCPYLVLWSNGGGPVLVIHCGRDQLHNVSGGNATESVIGNALAEISQHGVESRSLCGVITLGIATQYFPNDCYPEITSALVRTWGDEVVPDRESGTIDLKELILRQLEVFGEIPRENITHDKLDTFSNTELSSVRAGRKGHNMIIVHRTR